MPVIVNAIVFRQVAVHGKPLPGHDIVLLTGENVAVHGLPRIAVVEPGDPVDGGYGAGGHEVGVERRYGDVHAALGEHLCADVVGDVAGGTSLLAGEPPERDGYREKNGYHEYRRHERRAVTVSATHTRDDPSRSAHLFPSIPIRQPV
jgi:hypothetical protein